MPNFEYLPKKGIKTLYNIVNCLIKNKPVRSRIFHEK